MSKFKKRDLEKKGLKKIEKLEEKLIKKSLESLKGDAELESQD
jgi:hypothetical protein